jgi:ribose-phosphate pyrophosphokinase
MTGESLVLLGPDDLHRARDVNNGTPLVQARRTVFADGEQLVVVDDAGHLSGARVLVVQSTAPPQDSHWEALYQLLDICHAHHAASVECLIPYLSYGRQDRRTPRGAALSGPLHLRLVRALGAGRLLTVDRHSPVGPDDLPVVDIDPTDLFCAAIRGREVKAEMVVSADRGGAMRAARLAAALDVPYRVAEKTKDETGTHYPALPADLATNLVVVDDVCTSGSTLVPLVRALSGAGCTTTAVAVTHLLTHPDELRSRLAGEPVLLFSDSASTDGAAIPVLPAAIRHWHG